MRIVDEQQKESIELRKMNPGDTFSWRKNALIVTDMSEAFYDGIGVWCVSLSDGRTYKISNDAEVTPLEAEVVLK